MRPLKIGEDTWQFSIGSHGVGIQEPNKGKRHNVHMADFMLAVMGTYSVLDSDIGIGPGDVRSYIERVILRTQPLPEFTLAHVYDARNFTVLSSLPMVEVERIVREQHPRAILRGQDEHRYLNRENPRPWHVSDKHHFYDFTDRE